ncbi:MAG: putative molybdenum carrier protein [Magnetococcales bacterium]|nr:putative molybdenum carrier protein [Magnetococcales bacterium]
MVLKMENLKISRVVSGGQTGVDRAALDFAVRIGLECGGWCPKGRLALDGPIDAIYPLKETPSCAYQQRTEWNVRDSDGTLILTRGVLSGGTALTQRFARQQKKQCLILDFNYIEMNEHSAQQMLKTWLTRNGLCVLNIAGPREREHRGVYDNTLQFLLRFWAACH